MRRLCFSSLLLLVVCQVATGQVRAQSTPDQATGATAVVEPADVFVHVALVRSELELIRAVMGKPIDTRMEIDVQHAQPREVFFQALALFRTADQLCFEQARRRTAGPSTRSGDIQPREVYQVVDAALERVRLVKKTLGIDDRSPSPQRDPSKTPTDVFRSIIAADQQLNLLLDRPFSPGDAFEEVTMAVGYTARLLAHFPGATRIGDPPPFESSKQPADVYRRLTECFQLIRQIAELSKLSVLTLDISKAKLAEVTPSDVHVIASLIVSELAYLHAQLPDARAAREVHDPGRKFPSHVYQRAGILKGQLQELQNLVRQHPNWFSGKEGR